MAGARVNVHANFGFDFGPASRFTPPQLRIQENADPGGGQPSEPNALMFVDPDGEMHVFVLSEKTKQNLLAKLTGGIVVAGEGDILGGGT